MPHSKPRIYTSPAEPVPIVNRSIFTHLLGSRNGLIGDYPASSTAFVDAATGTVQTRGQLQSACLSFGYGLRNHPTTSPFAKRGDTVLIFAPNSLAWPVMLHGSTLLLLPSHNDTDTV